MHRFTQVDGDCELEPGLRLITSPGHTPGSQSVLVDTEEGLYILAGDYAHDMRCITGGLADTIYFSMEDYYNSLKKMLAYHPHGILLTHDRTVYDRKIYG